MLLTPHTIVGVFIASIIKNPVFSFPIALFFHFLGDLVPHWDFFTKGGARINRNIATKIALDMITSIVIGFYFAFKALPNQLQTTNIIGCAFFSNLPDGLELFYIHGYRWEWLVSLTKLQSKMQTKMELPWGIITQIALSALMVFAITAYL